MERESDDWKTRDVARLLALVETERRYYQEVVTALPVGLLILSSDLSIVSSNRESRALFGNRPAQPMTGLVDQFLPSDILAKSREVLETGIPVSSLFMNLPGPPERLVRVSIRQIRHWEDPLPQALLTIEEAPPLSIAIEPSPGSRYEGLPAEELLSSLDAIVWALELPSKRFLFVNEKAQELLGHPTAKWINTPTWWADRIHPADREWVLEAYDKSIASWSRSTCEYRTVSSYGKVVWLRESVRLLQEPPGRNQHLMGFAIDVTQRHTLEAEFLQDQRMTAVNRLATRVASEIVNQVMVISGFSEEIAGALEQAHPLHADLREIVAASDKLRALSSQLTSFHRHHALTAEPFDLIEFLKQLEPELRRRAGPGIPLELTLFPAPMVIAVDPGQLHEVILTLVDRARLSTVINAAGGDRVTLDCSPQEIEDVLQYPAEASRAGHYAVITVEDNGATIDAESRAAVFESLLPAMRGSSDAGEDLGPALSRAYSLARQWKGDIVAMPGSPHGNVFQLYIPRRGSSSPVRSTSEELASEPRPHTILVLEEEPGIQTLLGKMLRRQNYQVLEAADLASAQAVCRQNTVDLLIADIRTAEALAGEDLRHIYDACPKLEILYLSDEDSAAKLQARDPEAAVLQKPFTLGTLLAKVKEALSK